MVAQNVSSTPAPGGRGGTVETPTILSQITLHWVERAQKQFYQTNRN